jgi:hypothetical protein
MSDQHVFPDRLKHVVPRIPGTRQYGAVDLTRRKGKTVKEDRTLKQNQGSIGTSKVRHVCKPCNEGWLNVMEQTCFPVVTQLIREEKLSLNKDDQRKLVSLATSIALVAEWLPNGKVISTQEAREAFRRTLEPPPNWFLFIGRNASDIVTPFHLSDGMRPAEKGVDGPLRYGCVTMAMGSVLLHIVMLGEGDFLDVDSYAEKLGLAAIWPPTDWIAFRLMPALYTADVGRIRSYARESYRAMIER